VLGVVDDKRVSDSNDNNGDNGGDEYDGLVEQHKDVHVRDHVYNEFPFDYHLVNFALDSSSFPLFIKVQYLIQYQGRTTLNHKNWAFKEM
jgi:hypothetical protein